jgi:hypothetical protein
VKEKHPRKASYVIWLLGAAAFATVFIGHILYLRYVAITSKNSWADNFNSSAGFWESYIAAQDYFLSFSYALSASFAVWATARFIYFRRQRAAVGALGGVSLVTLLAAAGCFLIGCCGSPMLPIYISLFGAKAAGIGKPLMALITLISIGAGYLYVLRRPECRCADPATCPFPEQTSSARTEKNTSVDRADVPF